MKILCHLLVATPLVACSSEDAAGTITATVYGEAFIEDGIPAEAFEDDWAVAFDSFLVSIGDARTGDAGDPRMFVVDLAQPSGGTGYELAAFAAPAGHYDTFRYAIRPDPNAANVNADPASAAAMQAAGHSIWLRGSATNGTTTKLFDWGFALGLVHGGCEIDERIDGNAVTMQATIHADHFFYDDAVSDEPLVRFQLIADADRDNDGMVTLDELAARDIRGETRYQVGSNRDVQGNAIVNLRQYIELQATTLGHINGEGHCGELSIEPS